MLAHGAVGTVFYLSRTIKPPVVLAVTSLTVYVAILQALNTSKQSHILILISISNFVDDSSDT